LGVQGIEHHPRALHIKLLKQLTATLVGENLPEQVASLREEFHSL